MNTDNVNQLLRKYLESMHTLPAPNYDSLSVLTLSELRERTKHRLEKKVTQLALAKALGRGISSVQEWERGVSLKGIEPKELVIMANLFGCRIEEVIAAIENTRQLTKEGN